MTTPGDPNAIYCVKCKAKTAGRLQSCSIRAVRSVMAGLQGWNCGFPLSRERRFGGIFHCMEGLCNRPTKTEQGLFILGKGRD